MSFQVSHLPDGIYKCASNGIYLCTIYVSDGVEYSKNEYYKIALDKHKGTDLELSLLAELLGSE